MPYNGSASWALWKCRRINLPYDVVDCQAMLPVISLGRRSMNKLKLLDLFTGIGGFHLAGKRNGNIETICTSETDPFNIKFIDQNMGLDNAGDISSVAVPLANHPHVHFMEKDLIAVEETGFSTLSIEDFYEGVLDFPDIISGGFPCQDISSANLFGNNAGINGDRSGLVVELLRIIESLEPKYCVMENSDKLPKRGLDFILAEFARMGYIVEFETVAACHFGFNHYRHRTYLAAYLPNSAVALSNKRIFDMVRRRANKKPNQRLPLVHEADVAFKNFATVLDTRSVKLRTKRINSLGNAIIPDIAEAIFDAITRAELNVDKHYASLKLRKSEPYYASLIDESWCIEQQDLFGSDNGSVEMPTRGIMVDGRLYSGSVDRKLNPMKNQYSGMFSTLIRKDGNNNFTTRSRLNRPGKLGGLVGDIMRLGADKGGLNPEFCEVFMGYEKGYTQLKSDMDR